MDAKPQRPLRSMRTFNDENAHPDGPLPKTIHQRNKSSPALSANAGAIGLRAVAKRTAFGDVSNIAGVTRSSKEDALNPTKPTQPVAKLNHARSAALLRPAQRPLSVSSLRTLLTGSHRASKTTGETSQELIQNDSQTATQPTTSDRRVLAKRNTTIFKDISLHTVQEVDHIEPQKPSIIVNDTQLDDNLHTECVDVKQDPQLCLPPPSVAIISEPTKSPQVLTVEPLSETINHTYVNDLPTSTNVEILNTHADVNSILPNIAAQPLDKIVAGPEVTFPAESVTATAIKKIAHQITLPPLEQAVGGVHALVPLPPQHMQPLAPIEAEEYWEEEEDAYEEEDYVTARSFRSKGDNTTGGVTTVLIPRMNERARREIEAAIKLVEATRTAEEIEDECFDTSMVAEYGDEIFEYMRQLEAKMSPNPHYMDNQHEIQWSMRSVLMDWLVQVHHRFNLLPETLFLCVNYIDRFLSCKVVSLGKLQLVGATAIFIAAKYEEINCPSVQEIVYMVDGGYSIDEILKAERFMLTMLQFELGWPGPMSFLRRISKADDYDLETRTLAKYFLEVTLMDERFIGSPPSFTAAASHCLARLMLRKGSWSPHHVYYSGYTYTQLRPLVQLLLECCEDPAKHHRAVYDKYCDKRYKRASVFVSTEIQRGFCLPDQPVAKAYSQSPTYAYYHNTPYFGV